MSAPQTVADLATIMPEQKFMEEPKSPLALIDMLFLALLSLYVLAGKNAVPFHGDESTFLAMSRDYHELIYERGTDRFEYRHIAISRYDEYQLIRLTIGPISWFTIGLAWDLRGMTVNDLNGMWNWAVIPSADATSYELNESLGNLPSDQLLQVARIPSTLFLVFSVVVVFWVTWRVTHSHLAACVASLVYATTPAVLVHGRRALQEGAFLFATALTALLALRAIEAQRRRAKGDPVPVVWYGAVGVAGGVALACKHSSLLVVVATLLAILVAPLSDRQQADGGGTPFDWRHICSVTGAGLLAIAVFYLLNPAWWSWAGLALVGGLAVLLLSLGSRLGGWVSWAVRGALILSLAILGSVRPATWYDLVALPTTTISLRRALMASQASVLGELYSISERLTFFFRQGLQAPPQYFEVPGWEGLEQIAAQITNYERAGLAGRPGGIIWTLGLGILLAAGVWALVLRRRESWTWLLALWLLLPALALLVTNVLPWQRYYLVLYPPLAAISGLGLWQIRQVIGETRRRASRKDEAGDRQPRA